MNTTAAVKAETDICCTSSNAVEVVQSIPAATEVLFCPDQFLGAHVQRLTGRENMHIWMGECHVHAGINGADLKDRVEAEPDAELFVHPECGYATSALYLVGAGVVPEERTKILSTGGMVAAARETTASTVLVATETGMIHQLQKAAPQVNFEPVNRAAVCKYMKMITPAKLLRSLREGRDEITLDRETADADASRSSGWSRSAPLAHRRVAPSAGGSHGVATTIEGAGPDVERDVDVVVLGSGAAGLSAALAARPVRSVLVVTKDVLEAGSTQSAQGGLAGVLDPADSTENHVRDTLAAGAGLCDEDVVRQLVDEAPTSIRYLMRLGAAFTRTTTPAHALASTWTSH